MNVILFGATGMVGQGVLRECLLDPDVERLLTVGRGPTGRRDPKLTELIHEDLFQYSGVETRLAGFDACFFCLGITSVGMNEEAYRRITHDLTMAAAKTLARLNPRMTFIYVSGMGTDGSGRSGTMWARTKGQTENDLLALPFKAAYMFRPGAIAPMHGVRSKTAVYQMFYSVLGPVMQMLHRLLPKYVTTTEQVGRAMLKVAREGAPRHVIENADINKL